MFARTTRSIVLLFGLLALGLPAATHGQQPSSAAAPKLPPYLRQDLYPQWIDSNAQIKWPPNDGFAAAPAPDTLQVGTLIDRFGSEGGSFFSPKGDSFASRALPYVCSQMAYTIYRVDKPLHVMEGKAASWFGEPGGAIQFETDEPAYKLREAGIIEAVPNDRSGNTKSVAPCGGP